MTKVTNTGSRKTDHIRINLEERVASSLTTRLEVYNFIHQALPELDLTEIDLTTSVFGKAVKSPLFISSMTGGTDEAARINQNLAQAAQRASIAMGVGSRPRRPGRSHTCIFLPGAPGCAGYSLVCQSGSSPIKLRDWRRWLPPRSRDDRG